MAINRERVRKLLQDFDFKTLFIEEMGWSNVPGTGEPALIKSGLYLRTPIAQLSGVTVFEITSTDSGDIPDAKTRAAIHKEIEGLAHENLLVFVDADRTQSLWYWVKRDGAKKHPRNHLYVKGQPGDLFMSKLDGMVFELNDLRADGAVPITKVTERMAASLDVERVTKRFYTEFSNLRVDFIDYIQGIDHEADRGWYASVLLNRLMFVYFLQKKGFIQNNTHYLEGKMQESQQRGPDRYFGEFLQMLFFEGFAKPEAQRSPEARQMLGPIKYLNGGLFLPHRLELKYPDIFIPDVAFQNLLGLFGRYSWHLDDTPGAQDNEINPDVLGYIFEKYINQKAFGAYYTRTEITEYLCERTINAVILEKVNEPGIPGITQGRQFEDINELLVRLDAPLCRLLLADVLPKIAILDPACGSGAFLIAAMKTLLNIYAAVFGRIEFLTDSYLTELVETVRQEHPSVNYYIRKRIITDNLYGVDIMEEGVEIAKLRLFLALVASAQTVEQLEPLPNIDFNIMAGNSLIGLLSVDGTRFDTARGMEDMFQGSKADDYRRLLAEKNRLIQLYRDTSGLAEDLQALRAQIEEHRAAAYVTLNTILLDDFQTLGIRYEEAQPNGKAKKRALKMGDIEALEPFHWGYEFDEILGLQGGFDVIITNPPWEVFQTDEKEFFQEFDDLIRKKKIDIKIWEKQRDELLRDPEILEAWLTYASSYPHVSAYFKSAPQYSNQRAEMDGRSVARKINLYFLFVEQCFNLLREYGQCGIVVPSGIYTDLGTKQLRELLFSQTRISGLFCLENRREVFEGVHRSFKIVVLTFEKGNETTEFPAAFMRLDVTELDRFPDSSGLRIPVALIRRLSPDSLSVMEFKEEIDVQIAKRMTQYPLLGEHIPDRWNLSLTQEINMTSDSKLFKGYKAERLPLYEGKMIHQFNHQWEAPRYWVDEVEARRAVLGRTTDLGQLLDYQTYRLGFRDIARSTDARTLISTIIPPTFHGNKLPTVRVFAEDGSYLIDSRAQFVLCAIWNSFVVDYIIRQRVSATLNFFYIYQLPVPRLVPSDPYFAPLVERAAQLICTTPEFDDLAQEVGLGDHHAGVTDEVGRARLRAEIDGMVAHLYGLTEAEFTHILGTFPIVAEPVKVAALNAYRDVERGLIG